MVQGRLTHRSFECSGGEKRTVVELDVDDVGPSVRMATAEVCRAQRGYGDDGAADDRWSTPALVSPGR